MRIIGGELSGRKLLPPQGDQTRPVTDRAKQSLFDILAPHIDGAAVYDCFAGTGSMGLECLSRGAVHCTFFETHRPTLARLNQNIVALNLQERAQVIPGDIFRWFDRTNSRPGTAGNIGADLVFLDPPYRFLSDHPFELIQLVFHLTFMHLKPEARVIFRHDARDSLELPNLVRIDERTWGEMMVEIFTPARETPDESP